MTLSQLLEQAYGVKTTYNIDPLVSAVETTVTKVFSFNPNRLSFTIVNAGANAIYLAPDNKVAVGRGILLAANGGSLTLIWNESFELVSFEWYAIANGAASDTFSIEVTSI